VEVQVRALRKSRQESLDGERSLMNRCYICTRCACLRSGRCRCEKPRWMCSRGSCWREADCCSQGGRQKAMRAKQLLTHGLVSSLRGLRGLGSVISLRYSLHLHRIVIFRAVSYRDVQSDRSSNRSGTAFWSFDCILQSRCNSTSAMKLEIRSRSVGCAGRPCR
jgi:hypothetical protein